MKIEKKHGHTFLTGEVIQVDVPSEKTKRIFPKQTVSTGLVHYQPHINAQNAFGEFFASDNYQSSKAGEIKLTHASHVIEKAELVDNKLICTAKVLNGTLASESLKEYLNKNGEVEFSLRAKGAINNKKIVEEYGFTILAIDIVAKGIREKVEESTEEKPKSKRKPVSRKRK